ncbi:forkhead box protein D4-like [Coregonus clupeaformis]|uniref:forkhead box protein D4-like n=1 Tax=Coregonus clupeaformis TaxID=59861 RepID=UPI001BE07BFC|nr:forkhead box protein D4-like [Coregonus clupeaformis]
MEDISSCNTGRERLGIRFTIDYLLYNKDSKSMKEEPKSPQAEQTPHSPVEEQSPDTLSERESIELGSPEKGPEGEEGSEEEDEEKEEVKVEEDQEATTTDSPRDKPTQSYIALISMAILASEEKKLLLCDIYHWIMDNYPYFKSKDKNWRNSVRHNLSLNECFVKAGRSDNGKGHFWAIHPVNFQDFSNGDYHRRRARRRIRRVTGQLPFALHATYYPLHRPRAVPCWCCPPTHPLSLAHPLSCLSARMYWSWASLYARRHPSLHAPVQ